MISGGSAVKPVNLLIWIVAALSIAFVIINWGMLVAPIQASFGFTRASVPPGRFARRIRAMPRAAPGGLRKENCRDSDSTARSKWARSNRSRIVAAYGNFRHVVEMKSQRRGLAQSRRHAAFAWNVFWACVAILLAAPSWSDPAADAAAQATPVEPGAQVPMPSSSIPKWLNPATAPFLPIPLIGADPNSGTTLGLLPVRLLTDDNHEIRRILAPDLYYNPYFGYGAHARIYDYPSEDEQWSAVGGASERVERVFDAEYQRGRLREQLWSINASLIYDRSGT